MASIMNQAEVHSTLKRLFYEYAHAVYAKQFDKVETFYADDAVLVEEGKTHTSPKLIVQAIKEHHSTMKDWGTENFDETFNRDGDSLLYKSRFRSERPDDVIFGWYEQIWDLAEGGQWKIRRDQFQIDKIEARESSPTGSSSSETTTTNSI